MVDIQFYNGNGGKEITLCYNVYIFYMFFYIAITSFKDISDQISTIVQYKEISYICYILTLFHVVQKKDDTRLITNN